MASPMGQAALFAMVAAIANFVYAQRAHGRQQQRLLTFFGFVVAALALGAALASGMIELSGVVALLLFAIACYAYRKLERPTALIAVTMLIFVAAILLATHRIPGFHGQPLLAPTAICDGCQNLWLLGHLDKPFVGLLLFAIALGGLTHRPRPTASPATARPSLGSNARVTVTTIVVVTLVVMGVMSLLSAVRWAPKAPDASTVVMFLALNLFFTTFAEEIFFRMFLHDALRRAAPSTFDQPWKIIAVSTALFGVAHVGGGPLLMLGAAIAGLGYGYVYEKTQRIEWAIAAHFGVNVTHFFLFSYPRLAS